MKKIICVVLLLSLALTLFACGKEEENTAPTTEPSESIAPSGSIDPSQPADSGLAALTNRELIGKMIESGKLETPLVSAVAHTDEYWMLWLVQNCDPFRELLSRETGLESLKTMGLDVAAEYEDSIVPYIAMSAHNVENYLFPMLFPELFMDIPE